MTASRGINGKALQARFASKFVLDAKGCWQWTGTLSRGYGVIGIGSVRTANKRNVYAHRLSYELHIGPVPLGMNVCHRCDVKTCVNPAHLFLGTSADNSADMVSKGRAARGERHPRAKLTELQVTAIRVSKESRAVLAERFGVSKSAIERIRYRRYWRHVT